MKSFIIAAATLVLVFQFQNCKGGGDSINAFNLGAAAASPTPSSGPTPTPAPANYNSAVKADSPSYYWRMGDNAALQTDSVGGNNASFAGSAYTLNSPGAIANDTNTSVLPQGSWLFTSNMIAAPAVFTIEFWIKTNRPGGVIVGFGDQKLNAPNSFDRLVYLNGNGQVVFGVYGNTIGVTTITSVQPVTNNNWHHVAAVFSEAAGMYIYVDGAQVATRAGFTPAAYNGYWRMAYEPVPGWPSLPDYYYIGNLDEVAIYPTALSAAQISVHYHAGTGI